MKVREHWLNRERLTIYPRIFLAGFFAFGFGSVFITKKMYALTGIPLGFDFIAFWAASHMALAGHAQDAYDSALLFKAQQIAVPSFNGSYVWYYPPSFYLVVLPLALLPFIAAYWSFMLSTLGFYLLVLRRIVQGSTAMWCLAAFSGLWANLFCGQNGFLTAALAGAALLSIERKPFLAGLFIGLLSIKPHLALLFPVALLAIGAWRTLVTAAVTAITLTAIGTAVLGIAVLKGFFAHLGDARLLLENGGLPWKLMSSVFASLRLLGMPVAWAYIAHFSVAVVAVIIVWRVWRHSQNWNLRAAAVMTATFLVSPYVFYYDMAWLAFPIAWLALDGLHNGWLRGEREVLVVAWLLPLLMLVLIVAGLKVPLGSIVICILLWITLRRATVTSIARAAATGDHAEQHETVS